MRFLVAFALGCAATLAGCGKEIGDACIVSSDCSPNGDRYCDPSQKEGYCTIVGCDFGTCPDEAACIRFFTGSFANKTCEGGQLCSLDELCDLNNKCVPRNSETRYCMKACDSHDDCRDGYECRDIELMRKNGGEPVLSPPGTKVTEQNATKFCAAKPVR
jgi:hypothetical protein